MTEKKSVLEHCPECQEKVTHLWYDNKSPACICGWVGLPAGSEKMSKKKDWKLAKRYEKFRLCECGHRKDEHERWQNWDLCRHQGFDEDPCECKNFNFSGKFDEMGLDYALEKEDHDDGGMK